MEKLEKLGLKRVAFLQALALSFYISSVGLLMWNANKWFPVKNALGPILFLTLFSVSVLICGFLTLGYPVYLFWIKQQKIDAIKVLAYTTKWLILFGFFILALILAF